MATERQYCTFFLDDLYFGVEVSDVQEVLRYQPMTAVPLAPSLIRGLINLRGQIVTAIEMRSLLGLPPRNDEQEPINVILRDEGGAVSLLVDDIGDVVDVDETLREPPPATVAGAVRSFIEAVYKLDGRLLLKLDTATVINGVSTRTAA